MRSQNRHSSGDVAAAPGNAHDDEEHPGTTNIFAKEKADDSAVQCQFWGFADPGGKSGSHQHACGFWSISKASITSAMILFKQEPFVDGSVNVKLRTTVLTKARGYKRVPVVQATKAPSEFARSPRCNAVGLVG